MRKAILAALLVLLPGMGDAQVPGIQYNAPGGGGTLNPASVIFFDDFLGGGTTTGSIANLGWSFLGGAVQTGSSLDDTPSIYIHRNNGATAVASVYLASVGGGVLSKVNDIKSMTFRAAFVTGANVPDKRVGFLSTAASAAPSDDAVYFECLAADTNWFAVTRDGAASQTRTDTGVAYASATFAVFKIERTAASTYAFSINGVVVATHTSAQTPPAEATTIYPFLQNVTTGTANLDIYIDYFILWLTPARS